jgi:hypothetical protein
MRLAALLLGALAACGCAGYTTSRLTDFTAARTISVLPFENLGFRRDLELRLTQAVATELRARTSLALTTADRADLVLSGSMTADEAVISQTPEREKLQQRLRGTLHVVVTDRRTGRVVRQYDAYAAEEFTPGRFGESLEGSATDEWTRRVAERVVQGLERGF